MKPTDLLTLGDIAQALGVSRQAAQKWHNPPASSPQGEAPLRAVAAAMEVPVPEADDARRPRYPWQVVRAFGLATGYLLPDGTVLQDRGGRRWTPKEPTIDPRPGNRRRFYITHAAQTLGLTADAVKVRRAKGTFPPKDGVDELSRPYWWRETLEQLEASGRRRSRRERQPDDYDAAGRPIWHPGPDNPWNRFAAENQRENET